MLFRILFFSFLSIIFNIQRANAEGIDAKIEKFIAPFSDSFSAFVFSPVEIAGVEVPVLILLMLIASIFCTFEYVI